MSTTEYRFIEPLDVLFLRGNKLFGDPGSYGEALIPPWPSVASGAIRSRMLVDDGVNLTAFAGNEVTHPTLGNPKNPGSFSVAGFYLARKNPSGKTEILMAPPADLVIGKTDTGEIITSRLLPQVLNNGLQVSGQLPQVPVLAQGAKRSKPESGFWLTQAGWEAYLHGDVPTNNQLVRSSELWAFDPRVGIGMDSTTRSVETGKLFSMQAIAMHKSPDYCVGFIAAIEGATTPTSGLLRIGGDGRAATIESAAITLPTPDYQSIAAARRCRIVLTSPGIFPGGWILPGTSSDNTITLPGGASGKLVSAAVPRAETVSGWDLALKSPKTAERVAPTGSVYWVDELQATPEQLRKLTETGLWSESCQDKARRAEGFNRCAIGA